MNSQHDFMSGVDRDPDRIKKTSEFFTPTELVDMTLDKMVEFDPDLFTDAEKTFLDSSCGDGQFLVRVLERKMDNGSTYEKAISTIYGVEIMPDNVDMCKKRLLSFYDGDDYDAMERIVDRNIVCTDALEYHFRFDGTDPTMSSSDILFNELFEQ